MVQALSFDGLWKERTTESLAYAARTDWD